METKNYSLLGQSGAVPGSLILGSRFIDFGSLYGGAPYTSRPTQMQFWYKLTRPATSTNPASVSVSLSRTTGAFRPT